MNRKDRVTIYEVAHRRFTAAGVESAYAGAAFGFDTLVYALREPIYEDSEEPLTLLPPYRYGAMCNAF